MKVYRICLRFPVPPIIIDLSRRYLSPIGDGRFKVTFIDRATVEKITEGFIQDTTCIVRHCGRVFVSLEMTGASGGRYNLTMTETKLEFFSDLGRP
jgi:hypothetical protein